jgi:hypothetical protein
MADKDPDKNSQVADPEGQTSQPSDPISLIPEAVSPIDHEPESVAVQWRCSNCSVGLFVRSL